MEYLLNPNIAYVFLVMGLIFTLLAIVSPGTGMLEVGAFFCLALAGYAVVQRLSFNFWALIVLILGLIPFVYAIRKPRRDWALGLSMLAFLAGSIYLFPGQGWWPAVNPILGLIVSGLSVGFVLLVVRKTIQAHHTPPSHDLEALIGQVGEAKTKVHEDGSVQVAGELWTARSEKPIPSGKRVRVVGREGFILNVEIYNASKEE